MNENELTKNEIFILHVQLNLAKWTLIKIPAPPLIDQKWGGGCLIWHKFYQFLDFDNEKLFWKEFRT